MFLQFCLCQAQSGYFFQVHIYAEYFALGAKMLVSQYLYSTVWFCSRFRCLQHILFPFRWLDQERCLASCSLSMVTTVVTAYVL